MESIEQWSTSNLKWGLLNLWGPANSRAREFASKCLLLWWWKLADCVLRIMKMQLDMCTYVHTTWRLCFQMSVLLRWWKLGDYIAELWNCAWACVHIIYTYMYIQLEYTYGWGREKTHLGVAFICHIHQGSSLSALCIKWSLVSWSVLPCPFQDASLPSSKYSLSAPLPCPKHFLALYDHSHLK